MWVVLVFFPFCFRVWSADHQVITSSTEVIINNATFDEVFNDPSSYYFNHTQNICVLGSGYQPSTVFESTVTRDEFYVSVNVDRVKDNQKYMLIEPMNYTCGYIRSEDLYGFGLYIFQIELPEAGFKGYLGIRMETNHEDDHLSIDIKLVKHINLLQTQFNYGDDLQGDRYLDEDSEMIPWDEGRFVKFGVLVDRSEAKSYYDVDFETICDDNQDQESLSSLLAGRHNSSWMDTDIPGFLQEMNLTDGEGFYFRFRTAIEEDVDYVGPHPTVTAEFRIKKFRYISIEDFRNKCFCVDTCVDDDELLVILLTVGLITGGVFLVIVVIFCVLLSVCLVVKCVNKKRGGPIGDSRKKSMSFDDFERKSAQENVSNLKIDKSLFSIKMKSIELTKRLGQGGSGSTVYGGTWRGDSVCIKVFRAHMLSSQDMMEMFEREISISLKISHPHLIQTFGCSIELPRIAIVMELCEKGDLITWMSKNRGKIPLKTKSRLVDEIASGMAYLHRSSIIHRDLKAQNCLINASNSIKIIDFGLSRGVPRSEDTAGMTVRIGTSRYMCPEITLGKKDYDNRVDVFSYGIMIYEVYVEDFHPYKSLQGPKYGGIELRVANDPKFRPVFPRKKKNIPVWIKTLAKSCWESSPENRPSFSEIRKEIKKHAKTKK